MLLLTASALAAPPIQTAAGARTVALASTLGGYGLVYVGAETNSDALLLAGATGALLGPSMGHLLGGEPWRGAATVGGRSLALVGVYFSEMLVQDYCLAPKNHESRGWWDRGPCADTWPQVVLGWASVGTFAGLTVWDLWDAGRVPAREAGRAHATLDLTLLPDGREGPIPALRVAGTW